MNQPNTRPKSAAMEGSTEQVGSTSSQPRPRRVSNIISDTSSSATSTVTRNSSASSTLVGANPPNLPPRSPYRPPSKYGPHASPRPSLLLPADVLAFQTSMSSAAAGIALLNRQSFISMNILLETLDRENSETGELHRRRRRGSRHSRGGADDAAVPPVPPLPLQSLSPRVSVADTASTAQASVFDDDDDDDERGAPQMSPTTTMSSMPPPSPSSTQQPQPKVSKRVHALLELLSSERAYASDLALTRDYHIPMASGKPAPVHVALPTPPTSSNSSARTLSVASDSSSFAYSNQGAPMSAEDVKVIFSNIAELAIFSDAFCEKIEAALGNVIDGGQGDDHVGALFLEIIPSMEPKYKTYITRHPTALEHLSKLPQTPALAAYFQQTQTLTSSLTHAWDLPSFLIKPVQRLLKYPLLLSAILSETPNEHPDKKSLVLAKEKLEEVARSVNEVRRRYEVVREVLMANEKKKSGEEGEKGESSLTGRHKSKWQKGKKGMSVPVGVTASVQLGRMKSLRSFRPKEANEEAALVDACERRLKATHAYMEEFARGTVEWATSIQLTLSKLRKWALGFGTVIGLSAEQESEAFDAFLTVVDGHLNQMCEDLENAIKRVLLPSLVKLIESSKSPMRLLEALHALEPLHYGLLNLNFSKNRPPPALLEASQSYVALRGQLGHELPLYVALLERGNLSVLQGFVGWQTEFWSDVRNQWMGLWEVLCQEGEQISGEEETVRVWHARWVEVWEEVNTLGITSKVKEDPVNKRVIVDPPLIKRRRPPVTVDPSSQKPAVASMLSSLDPAPPSAYPESVRSHSRNGQQQQHQSWSDMTSSRKGTGRKTSMESMRSAKSGKSLDDGRLSGGRTKSMPLVPRRTSAGSGNNTGVKQAPPSPTVDAYAAGVIGPSSYSWNYEPEVTDRGRSAAAFSRKPSFRRKVSDTIDVLRPVAIRSTRSSSRKQQYETQPSSPLSQSVSFAPPPLPAVSGPFPLGAVVDVGVPGVHGSLSGMFGRVGRSRSGSNPNPRPQRDKPLYTCQVVHPCEPPSGIEYRNLPFFQLHQGDILDVLREEGHPSLHPKLPLYVDDGDDCLLLVRDRSGDLGWALASFLIPFDY